MKMQQPKGELNPFACRGKRPTDRSLSYKYFYACRELIEVTDCRNLFSLQGLIFMVMFLQSSAKLSTCYAFIGSAMRSALRMGFHRSISGRFDPIEIETRKRVFWVTRKMDIYVSALLGLPNTVSNDDIDQEYPLEVDDEFITSEGILPMPKGRFSPYAATNAHTRLVDILAKAIKYIYPIKSSSTRSKNLSQSYVVTHAKIRELEQDLAEWQENLPPEMRPGTEVTPEVER